MSKHVLNRLSATKVATLKEHGRHADGGGLYLFVDDTRRRWIFRYQWRGSKSEIGIGSARALSLARAREKATEFRALLAEGKNPKTTQEKDNQPVTFGGFADEYVDAMSSAWKNAKHIAQWKMTLKVYAKPLRSLYLHEIGTDDVLRVLKPIWTKTPETANRLRGRIESILDAAKVKKLRQGDNPARWRGHLDHLLPKRRSTGRGHHAALPFDQIETFIEDLRERQATSARALEFLILTAARTNEIIEADWKEIDFRTAVWNVPASRMKAGRAHRVPLTPPALAILAVTPLADRKGYIFKRNADNLPLSNMAMPMLLRRMQVEDTVHGFRSTFRDWAAEETNFPNEVCEMALAHTIPGKAEAAYRRGDLFIKRTRLMEEWARYCGYEVGAAT